MVNARLLGDFPVFQVNLFQGFDVFAHEADRHDHQVLNPVAA